MDITKNNNLKFLVNSKNDELKKSIKKEYNINIKENILSDVTVNCIIQLGKLKMKIKDLFNILPGKLLLIDKFKKDLLDIIINNILIAKGELVYCKNQYAIKIIKIINKDK